ncbi:MAG: DegV family protein [Oscillospiraceae bacterium]|nr:DegV family protein [Oscillospiraceae bacterium]
MIIMTDTPSLFVPAADSDEKLAVIPSYTVMGDSSYRDLIDIDTTELLGKIEKGETPKTSQPSIGEIVDVYEAYDDEILVLPIGDGLSGTYSNMEAARNLVESKDNIHVLDTKTLAGAQHHIVRKALELRDRGEKLQTVKEKLQELIESSVSFFIPTDFNFLKRSGRLTPIAAKIGTVLKIVPVMTLTEDKKRICALGIKRSKQKALAAIIEQLKKLGVDEKYVISVSSDEISDEIHKVADMLKAQFETAAVEIFTLVPSLVCHSGPACVLIQAVKKGAEI